MANFYLVREPATSSPDTLVKSLACITNHMDYESRLPGLRPQAQKRDAETQSKANYVTKAKASYCSFCTVDEDAPEPVRRRKRLKHNPVNQAII